MRALLAFAAVLAWVCASAPNGNVKSRSLRDDDRDGRRAQDTVRLRMASAFFAMDTCTKAHYPASDVLSPRAQLELVKELGYDGIAWTSCPDEELSGVVADAKRLGIKLFAHYCGATLRKDRLDLDPHILPALDILKGSSTLLWLHIASPDFRSSSPDGDAIAIPALRQLADEANARGLRIALYPHTGEWSERVQDAVRVARKVGRPNLGVTFNLCHCLKVGDEARIPELLRDAGALLFAVTINGADSGAPGAGWDRLIQTLDRGTYDVAALLAQLGRQGYRGPFGLQGYGVVGDIRDNLTRSMAGWRLAGGIKPPAGRPSANRPSDGPTSILHSVRRTVGGAAALLPGISHARLDLAGTWRAELDPEHRGERERWFNRSLRQSIRLPGSTDEARLGAPNRAPPSMDGLYRLYPYVGPAWFQRDIVIPEAWRGWRLSLFLERAHWETRVWIDGLPAGGSLDSLVAPHVHPFGPLAPGRHRLTVRADNTPNHDLGGFVSILYEGTQTNWNGLIGRIELRPLPAVRIDDLQVYPDLRRKLARVRLRVVNETGRPVASRAVVSVAGCGFAARVPSVTFPLRAASAEATLDIDLPMGSAPRPWDEFSPSLYELSAMLGESRRTVRFGMREFAARGTQLTMNGRPLFLRGTLECGIFPRTGYPPSDVPSWRRICRILKSYGLNFLRFHSWCPPDAAFAAADLEGIMLQVEGPQANVEAGKDPARDAYVEQELVRIVRTYGNHPSFCLMTLGNEYGGPDAILSRWVDMLRREDPRHLYSSPSCGQKTANRQFTEDMPRGIHGPSTDADFRDAIQKQEVPLIGHEIGQWTFYPNLEEARKYDGVLAPKNFELVRQDLAKKHMLDLAPAFFRATGRQACLLYKEEIEVLLRTPGHAGFSLLDLHDYPGQGTALIGLLDPFWDSKGFVPPGEHRRYCGPSVPLLRLKNRTFTTAESINAVAEIAHFGPADLESAQPVWTIRATDGRIVASGTLERRGIPTGRLSRLGSLSAPLAGAPAPCKLRVELAIDGTDIRNGWDIWVYSAGPAPAKPDRLFVSRSWDEDTKSRLARGESVLLMPQAVNRKLSLPGRFLPVFWSPIWFPDQKPNTMGVLCDPHHAALAQFPNDGYSDWHWWPLIQASRSLVLDEAPPGFRPVVQVIDNFAHNRRLGVLFEAKVGPGSLLVCAIDLPGLAERDPAARQMLRSLYAYAASPAFQPAQQLDASYLDSLFSTATDSPMQRLGAAIASRDSEAEGYEAANLLDGDPETIWHTPWGDQATSLPHEVVIRFPSPVRAAGISCLPRQDMANGRIREFRLLVSDDGVAWREAAAGSKDASSAVKRILFHQEESFRYLKLVALSSHHPTDPFVALAELAIIPPLAGKE